MTISCLNRYNFGLKSNFIVAFLLVERTYTRRVSISKKKLKTKKKKCIT